jgi:hypothetical protein
MRGILSVQCEREHRILEGIEGMMKRALVWALEVIIPAAVGGVLWYSLVTWGRPQGVNFSFICIDIHTVISVLVFILVARVCLRQSGSYARMTIGVFCGHALMRLFYRYALGIGFIVRDPTRDWYELIPLLLPAMGATIGYNIRRTTDPAA